MREDAGTIAFAEKVLAILELGSFSATYKYALFTAIVDLCLETMSDKGLPPAVLTTRQVAEKVTQLYWPHATPYEGSGVLRQGGVRSGQQAEIVRAIAAFRQAHAGGPGELHFRACARHPAAYERLLRTVEWKLIEMPLPRLQRVGREEDRFVYEYGWTEDVRQAEVSRYQRGERHCFDNRLMLQRNVAERLIRLTGVLRPIIQREWSIMIAGMNALPETRLEGFLFGTARTSLDAVRRPLCELQRGACFYCQQSMGQRSDVDHFVPWARYADDSLDNLVAAHPTCNNQKRHFFAAPEHLQRWIERSQLHDRALDDLADDVNWTRNFARSRSVTRALYTRLPKGTRVWCAADEFDIFDPAALASLF